MTLSIKEANLAIESILPKIKQDISKSKNEYGFGQSNIRISDIDNPAVKREGSRTETFCKIAEVIYDYGIATDFKANRELLFRFREITPNDKKPSREHCMAMVETLQRMIKANI